VKSATSHPPNGKDRVQSLLLEAAIRVVARKGLQGATTREIAHVAGVSEMTLFRRFGSKEKLVTEVIKKAFADQSKKLSLPDVNEIKTDLRTHLHYCFKLRHRIVQENIDLLRVLIGELHNFSSKEREIINASANPMHEYLLKVLKHAASKGEAKFSKETAAVFDITEGVFLIDALRRKYSHPPNYSAQKIVDLVVDWVLTQVDATQSGNTKSSGKSISKSQTAKSPKRSKQSQIKKKP
jgi:AcrR family transcriptional regulator